MTLRILTYGPNPEAPPGMAYAAATVPDGKPGSHWLATGATAEDARGKLESLLDVRKRVGRAGDSLEDLL